MSNHVFRNGKLYIEYSPHELDKIRMDQRLAYQELLDKERAAKPCMVSESRWLSEKYFTSKQTYVPKKHRKP